jgi:biotin carboxyl carrier protein
VSDENAGRPPASAGEGSGAGLEALTDEVLPALVARLRASRLGELEVRSGDWRVRLRRDADAAVRGRGSGAAGSSAGGDDEAPDPAGSVVRSTAVGYFAPAPVLVVGGSVQAGDLLGRIDVLGIAQEVTAPAEGIIAAVLAEDGQAVDYGQVLAEVDPLEPFDDDAEVTV